MGKIFHMILLCKFFSPQYSSYLSLYPGDDVLQRYRASIRYVRALPTMQSLYAVQYTDIVLQYTCSEGPKRRHFSPPQI